MKGILLNEQQQKAVDHIYGPMLVLAGPGTGKTQLLSARIANILQKTDVNAQNILCLTFTDSAAQNMRDRLRSMIGEEAYDVHIATYHGFGSDIIRNYSEYFEEIDLDTGKDTRLERPIDNLQQIQIAESIIAKLPYDSPLIKAKNYIKDVISTISELKRGLYTPETLRTLAKNNLKQVEKLSKLIADELKNIDRFPSTADKSIELFSRIRDILEDEKGLAELANEDLETALTEALEINKSSPLTTWKNKWLTKNSQNKFMLTNKDQHIKMVEFAEIFESYNRTLEKKHLYDYDDMILRSIEAMKQNDELRFNLQEKYQFILLDEFQDTNAAQFGLVTQLANNPVNEERPNVFAVGDDDQAIYAFQGARSSNMLGFINEYKDVELINLVENYRSHPDIIHTAHNVAGQIESRLHKNLDNIEKTLVASSKDLPKDSSIERHEFNSEANENAWVAKQIKELIKNGTNPKEIAVLSPRHKYLENLVPFLAIQNTPITYEKREDILQTPLIRDFRLMIELVLAAQADDNMKISELLPQVLSLEFYEIPVKEIWEINWKYRTRDENRNWAEIALENEKLASHVFFYLALGLKATEPLEYILDYVTGNTTIKFDSKTEYTSPLKYFYFTDSKTQPLQYYEMLTNLSTIREHIRAYQFNEERMLSLQDFQDFIDAHDNAEQPLINTHPIAQSQDSVQLMTAYKAKGLEFEHVFLLSVHDDIWGKKARNSNNKMGLPANLQAIRYQGSSEDELRRILFVAITRSKHGLYLTSHANKDNGKTTEPAKYLLEHDADKKRKTTILPTIKQEVKITKFSATDTMQNVETMWQTRHINLTTSLKNLLRPRLENYQMSPTHLNTIVDMEYGGPESFILQTLLRFPQAPGVDGEYGNAIHATLDWYQNNLLKKTPTITQVLNEYDKILAKKYIPMERMVDLQNRGHNTLTNYLKNRNDMFYLNGKSEVDFRQEGVLIGKAHLSGKIDRLEIDKDKKIVRIVDFKTGTPHEKWEKTVKLLKYKQQLYFYKFLIEGSHTWPKYRVESARLEFVEPNSDGEILEPLFVNFDENEEKQMKELIKCSWDMIQKLNFPDSSIHSDDYKGTMNFINLLIK